MKAAQFNARILVVEDEWVIALDIKRRLNKLGYSVVGTAKDAETALSLINSKHPDLVLMDIRLQGEQDGIQTAIQVRSRFHLPVIFLTAHADEATLERAVDAHPFGYLIKPFKDNDLTTAIQIALANHRAERIMQEAIEKERQLNELKSEFVSIVSHEFRNPLASLALTFNLLEEQDHLTPEQRTSHLQRGKAIVQAMAELINDILVVGEVNHEQFHCQPFPIDVVEFCRNTVEELQHTIGVHHKLLFSVENHSQSENHFYNFDTKLLQHILTNLLTNAIKYSPPEQEIKLDVRCEPDSATFCIQDQGFGISEQDQIHLFTPFYRGANVRHIIGTGLGLSIVKRCVDAHRGTITVDSQVGTGTTFTVTLNQCS